MEFVGGGSAIDRFPGLLRCGGFAALASVGLIVVQIVVFVIWPPAQTVGEVFTLMDEAPLLGLLSLDLVYLVNDIAVWLFYLGLAAPLWQVSRSGTVIAIGLGTLQMAAYFGSNPSLEMFALGRAYATADEPARQSLFAAGEAVLAGWTGTAFVTYYLLGAAVLLIVAALLRRTTALGRSATWWALAAGLLMLVPSSLGVAGMIFSLASLVPWSVFCIIGGRRLLNLSR